jgi:transposase InsO family protein
VAPSETSPTHLKGLWSAPESPGAEEEAYPDDAAAGEEAGDADGGDRAVEGAGVTAEWKGFRLGLSRIPPIPREDAAPEAVAFRRRSAGRYRRNPSVDEALAELTKPLAEPSAAELAGAALRARRRAKAGCAMRLPPAEGERAACTPQQRLLLLDTWTRSGLPAGDFGALVGVSKHTLYSWKKRFDESGPAGLEDAPRGGARGSRAPEVTKRAILMLKRAHPEYGCERISDLLARGPALPASAGTVARVLKEAGYEAVEKPTERHAPPVKRFERAKPNALWQTDLFTFVLKRQNRRLYMVVFMDDHSRFIVGWGLFSSPSTEWVAGVLKEAVASCQAPLELLTDNGPQYVTWRGASKFAGVCRELGVKQIVARPRRPQTLGKVERFWGTMWREFLAGAIFEDGHDARHQMGLFIDAYNFDRPHQGMDGATPAERYFGQAAEAKAARDRRREENKRRLAAGWPPVTGENSPPLDDAVNAIPLPGADPLTAGLRAAAGMEGSR